MNPFRIARTGGFCLTLCAVMAACSLSPGAKLDPVAGSNPRGWVVEGRASGTLPGLGPGLGIRAWLRPEPMDLRAELHLERSEGMVRETLVWTPEAAVLFDRRHLKYTTLGEEPGRLDALEGSFEVAELWWFLLGGQEARLLPQASFSVVDGEWRGRSPGRGYRRPLGPNPAWSEILWRDGDGRVHVLRAWRRRSVSDRNESLALELDLDGSDLRGRVRMRLEWVRSEALGDSILDPIWEPDWD